MSLCVFVCMCRPRIILQCPFSGTPSSFLRRGSLIGLELASYARLTVQHVPRVLLSPVFPAWGLKYSPSHWVFSIDSGIQTLFPILALQAPIHQAISSTPEIVYVSMIYIGGWHSAWHSELKSNLNSDTVSSSQCFSQHRKSRKIY